MYCEFKTMYKKYLKQHIVKSLMKSKCTYSEHEIIQKQAKGKYLQIKVLCISIIKS